MIYEMPSPYDESKKVYLVSAYQCWVDGNYATKRAAHWAFQFSPCELNEMMKRINQDEQRPITTEDLKKVKHDRKT